MALLKIITERKEHQDLKQAVLDYLSEFDNPVPDASYRRLLRNRLREMTGAPPERPMAPPRPRR